jgi:hypothetical protein
MTEMRACSLRYEVGSKRTFSAAVAVMLPDGQMFGRVWRTNGFEPIECISVAGADLQVEDTHGKGHVSCHPREGKA